MNILFSSHIITTTSPGNLGGIVEKIYSKKEIKEELNK